MRPFVFALIVCLTLPATVATQSDRVVILVRHAEKEAEPRNDPPLSAAGEARARALGQALAETRIDAVIVTPFARTRNTAAPLATALGLTPIEIPVAGGLAAHLEAVAAAVHARPAGEAILVVGHSNTIPRIIHALGGPDMADLCEPAEYAHLFILTIPADGAPRLIDGSYGVSDPPDAAACRT